MAGHANIDFNADVAKAIQNTAQMARSFEVATDRLENIGKTSERSSRGIQDMGSISANQARQMAQSFFTVQAAISGVSKLVSGVNAALDQGAQKGQAFQDAFKDLRFFDTGQTTAQKKAMVRGFVSTTGASPELSAEVIEQLISKTGSDQFDDARRTDFARATALTSRATRAGPQELNTIFARAGEFFPNLTGRQASNVTLGALQDAPAFANELANVMPRFVAAGKAAGLTFAETVGFSVFSTQKVEGAERAATGFEALVRDINKLVLRSEAIETKGGRLTEGDQILRDLGLSRQSTFLENVQRLGGLGAIEGRQIGLGDESLRLAQPLAADQGGLQTAIERRRGDFRNKEFIAVQKFRQQVEEDKQFADTFQAQRLESLAAFEESFSQAAVQRRIDDAKTKLASVKATGLDLTGLDITGGAFGLGAAGAGSDAVSDVLGSSAIALEKTEQNIAHRVGGAGGKPGVAILLLLYDLVSNLVTEMRSNGDHMNRAAQNLEEASAGRATLQD